MEHCVIRCGNCNKKTFENRKSNGRMRISEVSQLVLAQCGVPQHHKLNIIWHMAFDKTKKIHDLSTVLQESAIKKLYWPSRHLRRFDRPYFNIVGLELQHDLINHNLHVLPFARAINFCSPCSKKRKCTNKGNVRSTCLKIQTRINPYDTIEVSSISSTSSCEKKKQRMSLISKNLQFIHVFL